MANGKPLPEGISLQDLQDNWNTARTQYTSAHNRMRVLDLTDRGEIWNIIAKKFPEFQITPDTNYVNYIKENILASVYTVGRNASVLPRKKEDVELTDQVNKLLDNLWGVLKVSNYQLQAGERAALLNLGITQVGWKSDVVGGTVGKLYQGDVVFKNVDPMNYMRDPFAPDLHNAAYVIFHDEYHKTVLQSDPDYAAALSDELVPLNDIVQQYSRDVGTPATKNGYFRLVIHWVKVYDKAKQEVVIHEIHTLNNQFVLQVKEDIKPSVFPFAELYSSIPVRDPIGVSEASKILSSSIVLNLLDGLMVSQAYKAHRPPKLISDASGLNLRSFAQYGNDPDKTFIVRGDASKAVHYVTFPTLPQGIESVAMRIAGAVERMSGIDAKYTGKDTGSILTTGGIDSMLAQATMRDATRIRLYEDYTKSLTELVLQFLVEFGDKRTYVHKIPTRKTLEPVQVDFPKLNSSTVFSYAISIDAEIPKNKARMAAAADAILEKSMQYAANPPILTVEEWLMYQDFPQKDIILERLEIDRQSNMTEQVTEILSTFAGLIEQGMDPNVALDTVVQQLQNPQQAQKPQGQMPGPMVQ